MTLNTDMQIPAHTSPTWRNAVTSDPPAPYPPEQPAPPPSPDQPPPMPKDPGNPLN
ncbi:hypothetical protein [Gluconacetobacter diazotrophicus]|nr:hypothetical protein [Gluconacetobacter diazotrophicus]MBB2156752.1 hypothetical protein [Gluconacetobacter diazotrophicus]